ncbi:MAG: LPS export ABC transporter periplasmic protein LptC [Mariprofundus sp.]|nr:LPS export ABC transporter periplasmic protein LptC [Mariprofundus sp.]
MRPTLWRSIKWISLGISVSSIVLAIVLLGMSGPEQATPTTATEEPNTQVESPVMVERKDGNVVWTLRAEEANQQLDGNMQLTHPTLELYTENQQKIIIVSQKAWFNPITRNLRFEKDVFIRYNVWSASSDLLLYISDSDELQMPNTFKIWGKSIQAHGKNMHLHRDSEQVTVDEGIWIEDSEPQWQGVAQ